MKLLLIDHNPEVLKAVGLTFRFLWPEATVLTASEGSRATEMAEIESPDAIVLDLDLPDIDGFEVIRQIRLFSDVPIIILTERSEEIDTVRSLETGADDYIVKPFSPLDLLARAKATLRRAGVFNYEGEDLLPPLVIGELTVDFSTREILLNSKSVHLTPIEYKLLHVLVRNEGRVVTHEALRRKIWGNAEYVGASTVKKNIAQLRRKLGDTPGAPKLILNERSIGYRFVKSS